MHSIHHRSPQGLEVFATLRQALGRPAQPASAAETLLFIHPHDDDANIGAGMTIALAIEEGFNVQIAIATDGSLGYCSPEEQTTIAGIRRAEAIAAYAALGVPAQNLHFLGYRDGTLYRYIGRRRAEPGDPQFAAYTGLENTLTHLIRSVAPQCIFVPASTDLHPDHQAVNKELMISIYHAAGAIWPELGAECALPQVYEYPTYVKLAEPPNLMIQGDAALLERKLASIRCYASQRQIERVVDNIRQAGPVEFLRNIQFQLYHPAVYRALFSVGV